LVRLSEGLQPVSGHRRRLRFPGVNATEGLMGPTTIARGITRGRVTEPGRRYPSRRGTTLTALGPVSGKRQRSDVLRYFAFWPALRGCEFRFPSEPRVRLRQKDSSSPRPLIRAALLRTS
jgi:hypothetical protein